MYVSSKKQKEVSVAHHVKKGDTVVVLSGKDRGKQGRVLRVTPTKGTAIVERVNFTKKHTRPNPSALQPPGDLPELQRAVPAGIASHRGRGQALLP